MEETKISTGSFDLNKWLFGGYEKDVITTIYGGPGVGKSNLCLIAIASQIKNGNKVVFIDTEGSFSLDRLRQLIGNEKSKEEIDEVLKNLLIFESTSFQEQYKDFGKLLKEVSRGQVSLIVVDGITMLYRLELAEAKDDQKRVREVNSILARQMTILAEIARKKNIPVIVTNQVYSDFKSDNGEVKMVGGDILKYWSKCIIELKNEHGRRRAILRKHRSLKEKEFSFEIIDSGIRRKGWI